MVVYAVVITLSSVRPSLFTLVTADIALLVVVVAALGVRHRMMRRRKHFTEEAIRCGQCQQLIPPEKFNCLACGWPNVPEKDEESQSSI
jgi:hypothetical protein